MNKRRLGQQIAPFFFVL